MLSEVWVNKPRNSQKIDEIKNVYVSVQNEVPVSVTQTSLSKVFNVTTWGSQTEDELHMSVAKTLPSHQVWPMCVEVKRKDPFTTTTTTSTSTCTCTCTCSCCPQTAPMLNRFKTALYNVVGSFDQGEGGALGGLGPGVTSGLPTSSIGTRSLTGSSREKVGVAHTEFKWKFWHYNDLPCTLFLASPFTS